MGLTGLPTIALAGLATLGAGAATVLLWRRGIAPRAVALLVTEALVVFSAGLVVNRDQQFYPSWSALFGRTGAVVTAEDRAGRLDASFVDGRPRPWQPPGSDAWRLSTPATVTVPAGYAAHRLRFPVLLALGGPATPVPADAITVTLDPGPGAEALPGLPALLGADLRTGPGGWALLTTAADRPAAERVISEFPGRFAALAVVGAGRAPTGVGVPVHVAADWPAATAWAVTRTAPALAPPRTLPAAVR